MTPISFPDAIKNLTSKLKDWNTNVFRNIFKQQCTILNRINGLQNSPRYSHSEFLDKFECDLNHELDQILENEEILLLQKSRANWINGDYNTRYYHAKIVI